MWRRSGRTSTATERRSGAPEGGIAGRRALGCCGGRSTRSVFGWVGGGNVAIWCRHTPNPARTAMATSNLLRQRRRRGGERRTVSVPRARRSRLSRSLCSSRARRSRLARLHRQQVQAGGCDPYQLVLPPILIPCLGLRCSYMTYGWPTLAGGAGAPFRLSATNQGYSG